MIGRIFIITSLVTLCLFLYGILTLIVNTEENECTMTYMFEYPQFVKINFKENEFFPKYNLYAYSEGHLTEKARNMQFTGAPIIFIPGNAGSYKQVRSLASVALRKGLENKWPVHIDYYTIDFNEEYTGLFGGILFDQTLYVEPCIKTVLSLYKNLANPPQQVILVGHSMGGKIAQAIPLSTDVIGTINSIITIATPIDKPVLSLDYYTQKFYQKVESFWRQNREISVPSYSNSCCMETISNRTQLMHKPVNDSILNNIFFLTIGGGSRDIQIRSGLTNSIYSDIHVLSTTIPNVWLTTDHLCSVWCKELVLVINRFLYSIIEQKPAKQNSQWQKYNGLSFSKDKNIRMVKALQYFKDEISYSNDKELETIIEPNDDIGDWVEDSRRVFMEKFKFGINRTRVQMIRLLNIPQYKFLKVETINLKTDSWIYGCVADEFNQNSRYCSKAVPISQYVKKLPSLGRERKIVKIDLHSLKKANPDWTHVLLKILPTKEPLQYFIDIFNPAEREIEIPMPKWYSFSESKILDDTILGSTYYKIKLMGLEDVHQALALKLQIRSCSKEAYHTVAKICVPWSQGFERFHYFTKTRTAPFYISVDKSKPQRHNASLNPVTVELNLDPNCRYRLSVQQSVSIIMNRIVQQFIHWLPAHMVAIILLSFRQQISLTPNGETFKCGNFHSALCKLSPFFIITVSRVFAKFILWFKFLPSPESYDESLLVSIIIHGVSLALLTILTGAVWASICFFGNFAYKIILKLISLPIPHFSSPLIKCIEKFPLAIGVLLISISLVSCGGIALICASIIYFILLTKMYEDYLEQFVFKTAQKIAEKLFGKNKRNKNEETLNANDSTEITNEEDETSKELDKLLKEAEERTKPKKTKQDFERLEYDSINENLHNINFHLPLIFLTALKSVLNLPSTVTWAKNYRYSTSLKPDPSLITSIVVIFCSSILWQMNTPRNIPGYKLLSSVLYTAALLCVLYCQESLYRLNFIIALVFIFVVIHQLIMPTSKPKTQSSQEVEEKLERIKQFIEESRSMSDDG